MIDRKWHLNSQLVTPDGSVIIFDAAVDNPGFVLVLDDLAVDKNIACPNWPDCLHLNVNLACVHGILLLGDHFLNCIRVVLHPQVFVYDVFQRIFQLAIR